MKNEEIIEEIVKERIRENEKIFDIEELKLINNNFNVVIKIYLLGILDNYDVNNDVNNNIQSIKLLETKEYKC